MPTIDIPDLREHAAEREVEILGLRATVRELRAQVEALEQDLAWEREQKTEGGGGADADT